MKHRITYLIRDGEGGVDPASIQVKPNSVKLPPINAAEEWRLTIGMTDLSTELRDALQQCHELHIRWSSQDNYDTTSPFISRAPVGLHVFFTPRNDATKDTICPMLHKTFGHELKCHSVKNTFTTPQIISGSERFASSASFQYFHPLSNLSSLSAFMRSILCDPSRKRLCQPDSYDLSPLTYLDIDYDTINPALTLTGYFSHAGETGATVTGAKSDRTEVGVLNNERPDEPEELKLGGFLTVLGEDDRPSPTLFGFPSRHHLHPSARVHSSFNEPTGLHPVLHIQLTGTDISPPRPGCKLHAYLTLPSALFVDKYQFSDPLFLSSHSLTSLRSLSGATDLEAPDWVIQQWGSAALFELTNPSPSEPNSFNATLPLHLRYLSPDDHHSTIKEIQTPDPVVFYACPAEEGLKMATNPFDRVNLGYDGLFGPKTLFFHLEPSGAKAGAMARVEVPVLAVTEAQGRWIEIGTAVAVAVGFAWVLFKLLGSSGGGAKTGVKKDEVTVDKVKVSKVEAEKKKE